VSKRRSAYRKGFEPDPEKLGQPPRPPQGGSGGSPKPPIDVHDEVRWPDEWPEDLGAVAWDALFVTPDFARTWDNAAAALFRRHCDRCPGPQPDWNVHPELKPGARKPCLRCRGTSVELTALERWDDTEMTLRCYMWTDDAIAQVKAQLQPDDMLVAARMYSVEIERGTRHITFNRV
jgi:hypothetical protein